MKKVYLAIASIMMLSSGFGQGTVQNTQTIKKSNNPVQTGEVIQNNGVISPLNQNSNNNSNTSTFNTSIYGTANSVTSTLNNAGLNTGTAVVNIANTNGIQTVGTVATINNVPNNNDHHCKSHSLTQSHYEDRGVWNQSYQEYVEMAENTSPTPNMYKTPGTNTIAVIFHVVHEGEPVGTGTNVSNAAIMAMYNDLVEDFSLTNADQSQARGGFGFTPVNTGIDFCLAQQDEAGLPLAETGVVRVSTTETWFDPDDNGEVNAMKSNPLGSPIWDRNDYLNVWICDISNGAGSGTAGYAYRPQGTFLPNSNIDGIVVDYNLGVNNDNVLTHEVGHYLGLMHTWGNSGGCSDDDSFSDTPITAGPSFNYGGSCSGNQEVCSGTQTQYENYMDYANCTVMFTQMQSNHMNTVLSGLRSSLLLSPGCDPAGPPTCDFTSSPAGPGPVTIGENGTMIFTDASNGGPTSWTWTISGTQGTDWDFTGGTNANSQNPQVTFYNAGSYNVTLSATNGFGTCAGLTENGYVNVVAPAVGLGCDTLRNWDPVDMANNGSFYYGPPGAGWGYVPGTCDPTGTGSFLHLVYAEQFNYGGTAEVRRVRLPIMQLDNESGNGAVTFHVMPDAAGVPGTPIASETYSFDDLAAGFWNEIDFTTPASVTGNFWVGYQIYYETTQDTVRMTMTNTISGGNDGIMTYVNGVGWWDYGYTNSSIVMDVLLSNGLAPIADLQYTTDEVCSGGEVTVNGSGSTNTTDYYWWQTDDPITTIYDTDTTAGTTFTFGFPAGDYGIILFADGSCMTDVAALPVTVNAIPSASIGFTNTTCGQNNGTIDFTAPTGGSGVYEYSIDGGVTYQSSGSFANLPAGTYDVYIRTTGDNCENTASVTIAGSSVVVGTLTPATIALCEGQSTVLTAGGGTTYTFYDGATVLQTGATNTLSVTPTASAQYTVEVVSGVCSDLQYANVTVNQLEDASFDFFDFCDGSPNSAVNIGTPGGTFTFTTNPNGANINGTTGEITNELLNTTYVIEYSVGGTCPNTSSQSVTVNAADDASFTTADYCAGGVNVVSGIGTSGGVFTYDGADASTINPSTGVITGGITGTTYNITYTTPAGPCQAVSAPFAVTVNTTPTVNAVGNQTVCSGDDFTAITFTGTGGGTYTWSNDNTNVGLGITGTGDIAAFAGTTSGTSDVANITVTPSIGSCTGTTENFVLTVNLTPTVGAGTDQSICVGDPVTLTATNPDGATIGWDNSVTDGASFTPSAGSVPYEVTATLGTCVATDQVTVDVNITPSVDAGLDTTLCQGSSLTLTATNPDSGILSWTNGITDATAFTVAAGAITYTVTSTLGSCSSQDQVIVTGNAAPGVSGAIIHDDGSTNGEIDVTIIGGTGPTTFTWSNSAITEDQTDLAAGDYTITVTDSIGCQTVVTFTVLSTVSIEDQVQTDLEIFPNPTSGDITIKLDGEYEIVILDARGRLIIQKTAADQTKMNLSEFESGVYFIHIQKDGEQFVEKLILK